MRAQGIQCTVSNFTCVEVGELGDKDDAPEESGHDAQCGERDVRPERQAETACHAEVGRVGLGPLNYEINILCSAASYLFTSDGNAFVLLV